MSDHPDDETLTFKGHPVRIHMIGGVPYFCAEDICDAVGWGAWGMHRLADPKFPEFAKRTCWEETDDGNQDIIMISSVGVWYLTDLVDAGKGQAIAAWARREALRLCPEPAPKDPAIYLTFLPGTELPPCPRKWSGRRAEWDEMRYSDEYLLRSRNRPSLADSIRSRRDAIMADKAHAA